MNLVNFEAKGVRENGLNVTTITLKACIEIISFREDKLCPFSIIKYFGFMILKNKDNIDIIQH